MSGLISGRELMDRLGLSPYELFHRFIRQGIEVFNKDGHEVSPAEVFFQADDPSNPEEKTLAWNQFHLPGSEAETQEMLKALESVYFQEYAVIDIGRTINLEPAAAPVSKPKPTDKHPRVRHRNQTRAVAKEIWDKYPHLTVPEMAWRDEVLSVAKKTNGELYAERTIKDWIKDLNPNPPLRGAPRRKTPTE